MEAVAAQLRRKRQLAERPEEAAASGSRGDEKDDAAASLPSFAERTSSSSFVQEQQDGGAGGSWDADLIEIDSEDLLESVRNALRDHGEEKPTTSRLPGLREASQGLSWTGKAL